jgi:anti-sigma regulatory factor (Ser/Thr protein kinase)
MTTVSLHRQYDAFSHEALLYETPDELLAGTLRFVREGVAGGEPVLVVLAAEKNERLRKALGADARSVHFADMGEVGANPARIIPAWHDFVDEHQGWPIRGIGEPIWRERDGPELVECQRHESLLNLAFTNTPSFRLLCPYDTSSLDEAVIDEARRSHPLVHERGEERRSDRYRGLNAIAAPFDDPLADPPAAARELWFAVGSLGDVRELVFRVARQAGLSRDRSADLVTAVNEVATNSVRYGGGEGVLKLWTGAEWLRCEIADRGSLADPLAGRRPPRPEQRSGRGLWIANQVCDLVQVRSSRDGTVVRLHLRRA